MFKNSLQNSFREFCNSNKFEINKKQIEVVKSLEDFLNTKKKLKLSELTKIKKHSILKTSLLFFYIHIFV